MPKDTCLAENLFALRRLQYIQHRMPCAYGVREFIFGIQIKHKHFGRNNGKFKSMQ